MSKKHIKIRTGRKTSKEFSKEVSSAICEIQKLIYEQRITDLDESQHYALLLLTRFQQQLIEGGKG